MTVAATFSVGETIYNGLAFDPKNWRPGVAGFEGIPSAASALFEQLRERLIPYAIAGGIAMQAHVAGRNTQDLDLLMAGTDIAGVADLVILEQTPDFVLASFRGLRVDILLTQNPLFRRVLAKFVERKQMAEGDLPFVTPAGMVILKLFALPSLYRQGDVARIGVYEGDLYELLAAFDLDDAAILGEIAPEVLSSDLDQLRGILDETRSRIASVQSRFATGK